MTIRTFQPGDEAAQVNIYNEAAAGLPKFKPATLDEVRRRAAAPDFDPATRFVAEAGGRPVGYAGFHANGRVSFPWCRPGQEGHAEPLFEAVLGAMRRRGLPLAFAAYRGDWPAQGGFFERHGFRRARAMVNFVAAFADMPTPAAARGLSAEPLTPADLPALLELAGGVTRARTAADLEGHLFRNPYFPPEAAFALRHRGGPGLAVGLLVANHTYADPRPLDSDMPCFRLGAFGAEGMQVKRVNGLFSFVAAPGPELAPAALDLMACAVARLQDTDVDTLAAQVPSDAPHLLRFYEQYFRRQGSFPVFEREP
jgi:hypothetical protein